MKRLERRYQADSEKRNHEVAIGGARFFVNEEFEYDNWNGGTAGHEVVIYVEERVLHRIPLEEQQLIENDINTDLNKCHSYSNESFSCVRFEQFDESDKNFRNALSTNSKVEIDPDQLSIWKKGFVRVFVSHRDKHKILATELAESLEKFGISSFVAHDTIEATKEWRREILQGLESMEIMLVFLTDDFHESSFTNQEVGYALGRNVPILSLKLGKNDPPGFIGNEQALRGSLDNITSNIVALSKLIAKKLNRSDRLQSGLVNAFAESNNYYATKERFERLKENVTTLTDGELEIIIDAYSKNDQLHGAIYLGNHYSRLKNFLEKTTNKRFDFDSKQIRIVKSHIKKEVPF